MGVLAPTSSARYRAPAVGRVVDVTALVGPELEPRRCDLVISDGVISDLRQPGSGPVDSAQGVEIDGSEMIAMPGMVDGHDHLRVLAPGLALAEGLSLDDFLRVMWATQAEMGPTEYRLGALLGTLQRLRCGMTTVIDHAYTFHRPGLDDASIAGYDASGVRWAYARGIMTRPYDPVCETFEQAEAEIRRLLDDGLVTGDRLFVAPVSIRQASVAEFGLAAELAAELDCGTYTHAAETDSERQRWQEEAGAGPIEALDRAGFLGPRSVLAHCVVLDDRDIELLAERGTHVVHCPTNNMKLAKGVTRVPDLLAAGVNVCLGVDMMSDMHTEMRAELGMHALERRDPQAVSPLEALQMATWRGAAAAGMGGSAGELTVGQVADIVLVDARSVLQAPMIEPRHAMVHATNPGHVRHVLVDGRLVVEDGRSTLVDEAALVAEVEAVSAAWLARLDVDAGPWFGIPPRG